MRDFTSGSWQWHFRDAADWFALDAAPERALESGEVVRVMPGERKVCRFGDCYFKLYLPSEKGGFFRRLARRLRPDAEREYRAIELLERRGIPVVSPVAWGVSGGSSAIITRAAVGTVDVLGVLTGYLDSDTPIPEAFLHDFSAFLAGLMRKNLYFPDFHNGNLLWNPETGTFTVVDPLGVRCDPFRLRRRMLRMLKRQFALLLESQTKPCLLKMLAEFAPGDPEALYRDLIRYNAEYVRTSPMRKQKRLREFRRGAFVRLTDGGIAVKLCRDQQYFDLDGTEKLSLTPEAAVELWERDFVFGLYRLPFLRIVGRDPKSGVLYRQRAGSAPVDPARRAELSEMLELSGLEPASDFGFCTDVAGRTLLVDRKFGN